MVERHPCKDLHDEFQEKNGLAGIAAANAKNARRDELPNANDLQNLADQLKQEANHIYEQFIDCTKVNGHP